MTRRRYRSRTPVEAVLGDITREEPKEEPKEEPTIINFDSWSAFVAQARKTPEHPVWGGDSRRKESSDSGFTNTKTFEDAVELGVKGWAEGRDRIATRLSLFEAHLPAKKWRKEIAYSVVGPGTLDMGRYIMGHPEVYMIWKDTDNEESNPAGRIIHVIFNGAASSGVSTNAMIEKGVLIGALINLIEQSGRRAELTLQIGTGSYKNTNLHFITNVMLKNAEDPLEEEKIAMALAHPATLRRLWFSLAEQQSDKLQQFLGSGYGYVKDFPPQDEEDTIYIPGAALNSNYITEEQYKKKLYGYLDKLGIEWQE